MKKTIFIACILLFGLTGEAQINPVMMLSKIPEIKSVCGLSSKEKSAYMNDISNASKLLADELYERRMAQKAKEKEYRSKAEANVAEQYGLSSADIEKMKNSENLSKAAREKQRREMADKMMMNSGGISMAEIDQIKGDTAAQKAWAQGYSTQKMAEQSFDPQKAQNEQKHNMNMFELATLQKKVSDSLFAAEGKYLKEFQEIEEDISGKPILKEIDSLKRKLGSLGGVDYGQGNEMDALFSSIKSKSLSYCVRYTATYIDVLGDYRMFVRSSIPAWNRLQKITLTLNELQTGVKIEEKEGTLALECIKRFLDKMQGLDQYYLISQTARLGGGED